MYLWKTEIRFSAAAIFSRRYGEDDYFLGRSLDVFISRLRKYCKFDQRLKLRIFMEWASN